MCYDPRAHRVCEVHGSVPNLTQGRRVTHASIDVRRPRIHIVVAPASWPACVYALGEAGRAARAYACAAQGAGRCIAHCCVVGQAGVQFACVVALCSEWLDVVDEAQPVAPRPITRTKRQYSRRIQMVGALVSRMALELLAGWAKLSGLMR